MHGAAYPVHSSGLRTDDTRVYAITGKRDKVEKSRVRCTWCALYLYHMTMKFLQ